MRDNSQRAAFGMTQQARGQSREEGVRSNRWAVRQAAAREFVPLRRATAVTGKMECQQSQQTGIVRHVIACQIEILRNLPTPAPGQRTRPVAAEQRSLLRYLLLVAW